ncbi:hypothetical protein KL930_004504 [Ogataea haglerorum]|nr:hypothetical protein KL950_004688 [Ogataea haglerorum]KAG7736420.1 hypothetical protein KL923_004627 [Ogataea haglerorum]KAG7773389.1 hypothetical protein KL930_004504 [Ogataea haglerorum]KAG7776382.1 hypothetical protein KL922_003817 [Ogataea haglerorum]KAG7805600.1 hypothetical protein KL924_004691 [Ogataea haglerorum]
MDMVEQVLQECLQSSEDRIHYLKPSSFGSFKTYDGIKVNGDRVIKDIFDTIETLRSDENVEVKKISVVGYSLGGLIARYCIGELYEIGFFDSIEPVVFSTFASPHLGVRFFRTSRILDRAMNFLGSRLVGQSGRDLFIYKSDLLPAMADKESKYFKGLALFKVRILLANVRNDRLVSFATSYISNYNPFEFWENLEIEYVDGLPSAKVLGKEYPARIVDLKATVYHPELKYRAEVDHLQRTRNIAIGVMIMLLPLVLPVILVASAFGTVKSAIRKSLLPEFNHGRAWKTLQERLEDNKAQHHALKRDHEDPLAEATQEIVENTLQELSAEDQGDKEESSIDSRAGPETLKDTKATEVDFDAGKAAESLEVFAHRMDVGPLAELPLTDKLEPLPYDDKRTLMCANLNQLDWIKIPVYVRSLNAHEGIVARRGLRRTAAGAPALYLWGMLFKKKLE